MNARLGRLVRRCALLLVGIAVGSAPAPGIAASITVNTLLEAAPINDGACTLREAILNANASNQSGSTDCAAGGAGIDTLTITPSGTINLGSALLLTSSIDIVGPGAERLNIRRGGSGEYRVFEVSPAAPGAAVRLSGMTISNGFVPAGLGGGVLNLGTLTLTDVVVRDNEASSGGGIYSNGVGNLSINASTLHGNRATTGGALMHVRGDATLVNTTISDNLGGAIVNQASNGVTTSLRVRLCTLSGNVGATGGIETSSILGTLVETELFGTILANRSLPNLSFGGSGAVVISLGNNLATDDGSGLLQAAGDRLNSDPRLAPLGYYGGPTPTHALLAGSPALDAGIDGESSIDQRGFGRGASGRGYGTAAPDIGAFELRPVFVDDVRGDDMNAATTVFDPVRTIARGIVLANPGDDVVVAAGHYAEHDVLIDKSVNVQGAGTTATIVDGAQLGRVFRVAAATKTGITNLQVINGFGGATQNGAGIENTGTLMLGDCLVAGNLTQDGSGAGIANTANLNVDGCTISSNGSAQDGGGIHNQGTVTITNSTISGNVAASGAGVHNLNGTASVVNSTVSGNVSSTGGGGITSRSSGVGSLANLRLAHSTVTANLGGTPGGILLAGPSGFAVMTMRNSVVGGNTLPNLGLIGPLVSWSSLGFNLSDDNGAGQLDGTGDRINTPPTLSPLSANGGTTQTHLPLDGSLTIEQGDAAAAPVRDQRGLLRHQGAKVDIGAVEVDATNCPNLAPSAGTLAPGAVGRLYSTQLRLAGAFVPQVLSVSPATTLPPGLSLSRNGLLSGIPTTAGEWSFGLTAHGRDGCAVSATFALTTAPNACSTMADLSIEPGQTVEGFLFPGDCLEFWNDGSLTRYYKFFCRAGSSISIAMNSTDHDAYLNLMRPNGDASGYDDDNGGGGLNARLPAGMGTLTVEQTGTQRIVASTYAGQAGAFFLSLAAAGPDGCGSFLDGFESPSP